LDLQKDYAFEILTKHFQTVSLKGFGIADLKEELLRQEPFCTTCPKHNTIGTTYTTIQRIAEDAYVWMDRFTIRILNYHSYNKMQSRYLM
jgi:DNA mismatch repair protein MutS